MLLSIRFKIQINQHKKVLLRERKRHTARHVARPWGGGGYSPLPGDTYLGRGVPTLAGRGTYLGGGGGVPWLGGYPPWPGYPGCEQTDACENSTFPHSSDAGGNNLEL